MVTTTITEITASVDTVSDRTDSAGSPITPDWKAEERRLALSLFSEGIARPDDAWKVIAGSGGTMNVSVGSGSAELDIAIVSGRTVGQGNYIVRLDEAGKTIALAAADPSNPRIDEVYLVVYDDSYDASGRTLPRLAIRRGDAASVPSSPGPDAAWQAYLLLASVNIPASAADILQATITDERKYSNISLSGYGGVPTGSITGFAGPALPDQFLWCRGENVSRTTYSRLFAAIGTLYGAGDGSTTFGLPNLQQRFPLGKAASGTGNSLGDTGGSIDHVHTGPSHTHGAIAQSLSFTEQCR